MTFMRLFGHILYAIEDWQFMQFICLHNDLLPEEEGKR